MNDDIGPCTVGGDLGNYYGGLVIRRINGECEWCIENYDGFHWEPCPPKIFDALVEEYLTEGTE